MRMSRTNSGNAHRPRNRQIDPPVSPNHVSRRVRPVAVIGPETGPLTGPDSGGSGVMGPGVYHYGSRRHTFESSSQHRRGPDRAIWVAAPRVRTIAGVQNVERARPRKGPDRAIRVAAPRVRTIARSRVERVLGAAGCNTARSND